MQALLGERAKNRGVSSYSSITVSYVLSVLSAQRLLQRQPKMLQAVGSGIENAARQAEHFSLVHDNVIANLASLYQETISNLRHRIQIKGNGVYLQQPKVAQRIRSLLFFGHSQCGSMAPTGRQEISSAASPTVDTQST